MGNRPRASTKSIELISKIAKISPFLATNRNHYERCVVVGDTVCAYDVLTFAESMYTICTAYTCVRSQLRRADFLSKMQQGAVLSKFGRFGPSAFHIRRLRAHWVYGFECHHHIGAII